MGTMMDYEEYSPKEQLQLTVCQRLIAEKSYLSQEEIRRDLQERGFETISQSTVSRLLKLLGVIKIRNAKGLKIYSLNPQLRPAPDAARTVSKWWSASSTIASLSLFIPSPDMAARWRVFWIITSCRKF